jgi:hypothetical protein
LLHLIKQLIDVFTINMKIEFDATLRTRELREVTRSVNESFTSGTANSSGID